MNASTTDSPRPPRDARQICRATAAEAKAIGELVLRVFTEFVADAYTQQGVREITDYVRPEAIRRRMAGDFFILTARTDNDLVGVIEVKEHRHISLLFVDKRMHRKGVGRELVHHAVARCREENPDLQAVTIQSAPRAVTAYEHLGFRQTGEQRVENGRVYVPMVLPLSDRDTHNEPPASRTLRP